MSEIKSFDELRQLPECVLFEVVREAELLIQAQLTCAIAADQRALTFAGFLITAATAAFGGGVALAMTDHRIAITALAVLYAGGLSYAAYLASESARPNLFCFPGNYPRHWLPTQWSGYGKHRLNLTQDSIEQAAALDRMLRDNATTAEAAAKRLNLAMHITWWSTDRKSTRLNSSQ